MDFRRLTIERLKELIELNELKATQPHYQNIIGKLTASRITLERALEWKLKNQQQWFRQDLQLKNSKPASARNTKRKRRRLSTTKDWENKTSRRGLLIFSNNNDHQKTMIMKTKTFNGVKIKNTEFAMGEKLFDMDFQTATEYRNHCRIDLQNCIQYNDKRAARVVLNTIKNINLYITALS